MLVVADDLSGAVEAAAVLGARRIALGHTDGDVVDLDTRELAPEEAARRVRALDGRITFKKIDSLLRGNVAAETRGAQRHGDRRARAAGRGPDRARRRPARGRRPAADTADLTLLDAETDADLDAIVAAAPPRRHAGRLGRPRGGARPPARRHAAPPPDADATPRCSSASAPAPPTSRWSGSGARERDGDPGHGRERRGAGSPRRRRVDLVLTGGETARRTLDALGVTTLETDRPDPPRRRPVPHPGRPPRHHPPRRLRRPGQPRPDRRAPSHADRGDHGRRRRDRPEIVVAALQQTRARRRS